MQKQIDGKIESGGVEEREVVQEQSGVAAPDDGGVVKRGGAGEKGWQHDLSWHLQVPPPSPFP